MPAFPLAMLENNWFMFLAVRTSSYGCTWKVWEALKRLESLKRRKSARGALLRFSRAIQTSRVHQ